MRDPRSAYRVARMFDRGRLFSAWVAARYVVTGRYRVSLPGVRLQSEGARHGA